MYSKKVCYMGRGNQNIHTLVAAQHSSVQSC